MARFVIGLAKKASDLSFEVTPVNGQLGILIRNAGKLETMAVLDIAEEHVRAVYFIRNPDKLTRVV